MLSKANENVNNKEHYDYFLDVVEKMDHMLKTLKKRLEKLINRYVNWWARKNIKMRRTI